MISAFWSSKGGVGATTSVVGLAASCSRLRDVTIVDFAGDMPMALGLNGAHAREGVSDWLAVESQVGSDALRSLRIPISDSLSLIPRGTRGFNNFGQSVLLGALAQFEEVFVDLGCISPDSVFIDLARESPQSLLVIRSCYLALQHALTLPFRPSSLLHIAEPSRALARRDLEDALGVGTLASIPYDPGIARALDAGLLHVRPPRSFEKAWRNVPSERAA